jgi:DivIVA domain-containing protein
MTNADQSTTPRRSARHDVTYEVRRMPLTPAEVHNVAFKKPPIGKRGYDEEEVDAFLDIVEVELARLIEENNDLRAHGGSGGPASAAPRGADPTELAAAREDNQRLTARVAELEKALSQGKNGAQQQLVQLQQQLAQHEEQAAEQRRQLEQAQQALAEAQRAQSEAASGAAGADHNAQAIQMLALAQQTADQHLTNTKAEAERLLAEAQVSAQNAVSEAQAQAAAQRSEADAHVAQLERDSSARAEQVVREAEQKAATITAQFEQRKAALERRVEELRVYEREYRTRLRGYLESQLRDLDASGHGDAEPSEVHQG